MCQIFWHMGTGQRAVPLEPALWNPLFFLIFSLSLSAQCVRHFAPISSNLGSGPTKLKHKIFWNFFFQKKSSLLVLNDRSKYPLRHSFYKKRPALFHFLSDCFKKNCFCFFLMIIFCTHVSDFLAYGYRSEGCASWASPLTPFIFFLIFSLSAQFVRHFAPISSNLGSGPTKLTLKIFWNFFSKKKFSLVLNDRSKYPPRDCLLMRPALFYFLIEFFK